MKRNKLIAAASCAAMLLTAAVVPAVPVIRAEETAAGDTTERFGHYGPLTYEIMEDGLKLISCEADAAFAEIPPEIDGVPITKIASNVFGANDALETVVWNTSVKVPYGVFRGTGLKTLTLGEEVGDISSYGLLDGCEDVHVIFDKKYAGTTSFNNCNEITEVTFTDKVEYSMMSFNDCPNLRNVHIGAGLKVFDSDSFLACPALESFEVSADNADFASLDNSVYSKDMTEFLRYPSAMSADSFTLPDSVEWVFRHAFYGAKLREVFLSDATMIVGESAFVYADTLEAIHVPETNSYYESIDGVLYDWRYRTLTQYPCGKKDIVFEVPEEMQEIGMNAFTGNQYLQKIVIPDSVHTIFNCAFTDCQSLKYAYLPAHMEMLGERIFERCENLITATFPEGIGSVPVGMFAACQSLREITLPDTVRNIDSSAFSYCTGLRTVNLPETMDRIEFAAFEGCSSLKTIAVPEGITEIDEVFRNCTALEVLVLPASLERLGDHSFGEEIPLKDVYYAGTQEQWQAVIVEEDNPAIDHAVMHYECTEPELPAPPTGDLDGDGVCSIHDVLTLQIYLIGYPMPVTQQELYNMDMTQDGTVNAFDLAVLKMKLLRQ